MILKSGGLYMLKPLGNRVILELIEEDETTTDSGLVLAGQAKEKPQSGKVVSVGPGTQLEDGTVREVSVAEGDVVIFEKYAGTELSFEDKNYLALSESDIIAIVE